LLDAAHLYAAALLIEPRDASLHVRCGRMLEQAGDLENARSHYLEALRVDPGNGDAGASLKGSPQAGSSAGPHGTTAPEVNLDELVPELAPGLGEVPSPPRREHIHIARLGRRERTHRGTLPTLRGVEAVRGYCVSSVPIVTAEIWLDSERIYAGPVKGGYPLRGGSAADRLKKYVFNIWLDLSNRTLGGYAIELRFLDENGRARRYRERIVIAAPLAQADYPQSDALVSVSSADPRSPEEQINARPSMIRPAKRALFDEPPKNVLVIRADQLGDMVCSAAAFLRLRGLFANSRMTALVLPQNEALCRSLGLFDEIITFEFKAAEKGRGRVLQLQEQAALRHELTAHGFDVAVDLSDNPESRHLLLLTGARRCFGFHPGSFPWLSGGLESIAPDPINGLDAMPYGRKLLGFAEWIAAAADATSTVIKRENLDRDGLVKLGLSPSRRFAFLHTGARLAFSRWQHFHALAQMLIERTALDLVIVTDEEREASLLAQSLPASERLVVRSGPLSFDELDLLVSCCSVFVGNDSGPKHLAGLRGARVVSLHLARVNWNQWGQVADGYILSRKVPCAGCAIHEEPVDCGKDFICLQGISADEAFNAVARVTGPPSPSQM
jgi:ADP-heptose:LPS heptosyltransferase